MMVGKEKDDFPVSQAMRQYTRDIQGENLKNRFRAIIFYPCQTGHPHAVGQPVKSWNPERSLLHQL